MRALGRKFQRHETANIDLVDPAPSVRVKAELAELLDDADYAIYRGRLVVINPGPL